MSAWFGIEKFKGNSVLVLGGLWGIRQDVGFWVCGGSWGLFGIMWQDVGEFEMVSIS